MSDSKSNGSLESYLNDHFAGSVAALELLKSMNASTLEPGLASFLTKLQEEIAADRDELDSLMRKLEFEHSILRKWTAWFVEKATELKLHSKDFSMGSLGLLESLEVLSVGIAGKHLLWASLAVASESV